MFRGAMFRGVQHYPVEPAIHALLGVIEVVLAATILHGCSKIAYSGQIAPHVSFNMLAAFHLILAMALAFIAKPSARLFINTCALGAHIAIFANSIHVFSVSPCFVARASSTTFLVISFVDFLICGSLYFYVFFRFFCFPQLSGGLRDRDRRRLSDEIIDLSL